MDGENWGRIVERKKNGAPLRGNSAKRSDGSKSRNKRCAENKWKGKKMKRCEKEERKEQRTRRMRKKLGEIKNVKDVKRRRRDRRDGRVEKG